MFKKLKAKLDHKKEYAVEYLTDVMNYLKSVDENWMLDDELSEIFENTKRFIKYWGFI